MQILIKDPRACMSNINANFKNEGGEEHIHVAIKHNGPNQQHAMLQTLAKNQGIGFNLLIDLCATHSSSLLT